MNRLRILLTGPIQLVFHSPGAERVLISKRSLPGAQGRLLLAMLVVEHARPVERDELAEELWPGEMPTSWEVGLRALVSKTRSARGGLAGPLGQDLILSGPGAYRWQMPPHGWIDVEEAAAAVHRAEAALLAADWRTAASDGLVAAVIAARPFLTGLDSPWIERQRERLLAIRLRALDCTGDVWLRKGDAGEAAREAGRCLQLDPYHEPAVRRLMRAAAASGDHAAVARAYDAFRQRLNDELGVEPAPETTDLRHRLLMEGRRDT